MTVKNNYHYYYYCHYHCHYHYHYHEPPPYGPSTSTIDSPVSLIKPIILACKSSYQPDAKQALPVALPVESNASKLPAFGSKNKKKRRER